MKIVHGLKSRMYCILSSEQNIHILILMELAEKEAFMAK